MRVDHQRGHHGRKITSVSDILSIKPSSQNAKSIIFNPCYVLWIEALISLVQQELDFFKIQNCNAYDKSKFFSLKERSNRVQNALWDALQKLLIPNETVVCELCVRPVQHEGISAVATAEALNRGKAWPKLDIQNLFQGRLLQNPFQGSRTSWPDLILVALYSSASNMMCDALM